MDGKRGSDSARRSSPAATAQRVEVELGNVELFRDGKPRATRRQGPAVRAPQLHAPSRRTTTAARPVARNGAGSRLAELGSHTERCAQPFDDALDVEEVDGARARTTSADRSAAPHHEPRGSPALARGAEPAAGLEEPDVLRSRRRLCRHASSRPGQQRRAQDRELSDSGLAIAGGSVPRRRRAAPPAAR